MKQKTIEFNKLRVLMWEDQSVLIEHEDERSLETSIGELLYIVQEWQNEFGSLRFKVSGEWRGFEGSL